MGTLRGGPRFRVRCKRDRLDTGRLEVHGTHLAYVGCTRANGRVVVRDLARPRAPGVLMRPRDRTGFAGVQLRGRYVAAATPGRVVGGRLTGVQTVVFRRDSGAELYRINGGGSLSSDGRLFTVLPDPEDPTAPMTCARPQPVAWYSPREPVAHVLPVRSCGLALMRRSRVLIEQPVDSERTRIAMTDTQGSEPVALTAATEPEGGLDFDGTRLVRVEESCEDSVIVLETIDEILRFGPRTPPPCKRRGQP